MAGFDIDVGQVILLSAELGAAASASEAMARVAVRKTAADVKSTARTIVPVDLGNLKRSIHTRATGKLSSDVTADASYAFWVENGTSKMSAQPYMRPSADRHEAAFYQAMEQIAGRALGG